MSEPHPSLKAEKSALRKKIRSTLDRYSTTELLLKSKNSLDRLFNHPKVQASQTMLSYWPMPKEFDTSTLNKQLVGSKKVLLPVIDGTELVLKEFTSTDQLTIGSKYGILEPQGPIFTQFDSIDLVIVPGSAFSLKGERCGHGKGFYDRLLPKLPHAFKMGVCFDFQLLEQVPTGELDVKMDDVIVFR